MNEDQILNKLDAIEREWSSEIESFKNKHYLYNRKFQDEVLKVLKVLNKEEFEGELSSYCIRRINFSEWKFTIISKFLCKLK